MGRLDGKIAIVTGGAMGQGAGIARAFVAEGARVVIADVAKDEGQALADELGEQAYFVGHDVSDAASWASAGRAAPTSGSGRSTCWPTTPASCASATSSGWAQDEVELLWRVNQLGCFLGMQAVTRTMRKNGGGSIINASSVEGLAGMPGCTALRAPPSGRSAA